MKNISHFICTILLLFSIPLSGQDLLTRHTALPCLDKKFTIVAHIVRDTFGVDGISENDILTAIDPLNEIFAPICASFEICEFRYIDNFQYNIVNETATDEWSEMQVKYHQHHRINVFFTADTFASCFYFNNSFATLGGITEMERGGIVINKGCVDSKRAFAHEFGRYFGLLRTFQGSGFELVDGSNCETEGDLICDTPADPFVPFDLQIYVGEDCVFISNKVDANGQYYEPDVGNYMSYYSDYCACGFTYQQYLRMAETYLSAPYMW